MITGQEFILLLIAAVLIFDRATVMLIKNIWLFSRHLARILTGEQK